MAQLIQGIPADVEGGDNWGESVLVDVVDEGGVGGSVHGGDLYHDLVAVGGHGGTVWVDCTGRGHVSEVFPLVDVITHELHIHSADSVSVGASKQVDEVANDHGTATSVCPVVLGNGWGIGCRVPEVNAIVCFIK